MITGSIHVREYCPQIAVSFCNFSVTAIPELVTLLRSKSQSLKQSGIIPCTEIQVTVDLGSMAQLQTVDSDILRSFIRGQETLLFRVTLRATSLPVSIANDFQAALDQEFLAALKIHFNRPHVEPEFSLSEVFAEDLPLPSFTKVMVGVPEFITDEPVAAARQEFPQIPKISVPESSLRRVDYANQNHPDFVHVREILQQLPRHIVAKIVSNLGRHGLLYLCRGLLIFSPAVLQQLLHLFFSGPSEDQLFLLALPSGMACLEICKTWPPELIEYALYWLQQDPALEISFFEALQLIHQFWLEIKVLSPHIPVFVMNTDPDPIKFSQRLQMFFWLLGHVDPAYKKIQAESFFTLRHRSERFYRDFFAMTTCHWVAEPMLSDVVVKLDRDRALEEPSLRLYHQYVAQYAQVGIESFEKVVQVQAVIARSAVAAAWSFGAWVLSSMQMISVTEFESLLQAFSTYDNFTEIVAVLFQFPLVLRPSFIALQQFAAWSQHRGTVLLQVIQFYLLWHTDQPRIYLNSWPIVFKFLQQIHDVDRLGAILSQIRPASFELFYFNTLMLTLGDDLSLVSSLGQNFSTLSLPLQHEFLAIFPSIEQIHVNCRVLQDVLQQVAAGGNCQEPLQRGLPDHSFGYFKTAVDYDVVLTHMTQLLSSVKASLDFFLGDIRFFVLAPPVKKLLTTSAVQQLQAQHRHLTQVQAELNVLRAQKKDLDLSRLFALFQEFDVFFVRFVSSRLGDIFIPFLFRLLPSLDAQLQPDNNLQQLMMTVLREYDKIRTTVLAQHLKAEVLELLVKKSDQPVMERFLQKFLVDALVVSLNTRIAAGMSGSQISVEDRKRLTSFLGTLPMTVKGLNAFFWRYQAILLTVESWQSIEQDLLALNLHPELPTMVWAMCLESQWHEGQLYSAAHWHIVLQMLRRCILVLQTYPRPRFSMPQYIKAFFRAQASLSQIEVLGQGELKHVHLELLWSSLDEALQQFGENSLWFTLVPQAIDWILCHGTPYDFVKNLQLLQQIGGKLQGFEQLMSISNHDAEIQEIFQILQRLLRLEQETERPWTVLFSKLLSKLDIEQQLPSLLQVLQWLLLDSKFPWLEIILDDADCDFSTVLQCKLLLDQSNIWSKMYGQLFRPPSTPLLVESEPLIVTEAEPTTPRWYHPSYWIKSKPTKIVPITTPITVLVEPAVDGKSVEPFWQMFTQAPYPKIQQLVSWLTQDPKNLQATLMHFDQYPMGVMEPYLITASELRRWMQELEFYEYLSPEKSKIELRLKNVIALANGYFPETRTHLVTVFKASCAQTMSYDYTDDQADQLLAVIIALYYKSTGKRPYPSQILTMVVNLECKHKNLVFEVDTGEGKGITTAILAVLKWSLRKDAIVEIRTANRDLVRQDYYEKGHWRFFNLLGIPHAIIQENSSLDKYKTGSIYYTTQDDIVVYKELYRLQRSESLPEDVDIVMDEVDQAALDQFSVINLAYRPVSDLNDSRLYFEINEFVDTHFDAANGRKTWSAWSSLLKQTILELQTQKYRQRLLSMIPLECWRDWLEVAIYAKYMRENHHFIVQAMDQSGHRVHRVVPYLKAEIKYDFDLSYQMKSGLMQFLHARLQSPEREFLMEPETRLVSQLSSINLRHIHSLAGLSGSIGALGECRELKDTLVAIPVRIPRHYPSGLERGPCVVTENMSDLCREVSGRLVTISNPVLLCVPEIEAAQQIYRWLQGQFLSREIHLITGQESAAERMQWLHPKISTAYAGSKNSITVATLICGRGTDIKVEEPYHLVIMQVGVLDPRKTKQLEGRTARNNHLGYYQLFLDKASLLQWYPEYSVEHGHLSVVLDRIQHQFILENKQRRLLLRMKTWYRKYIFEILSQNFQDGSLSRVQQNRYYCYALEQLDEIKIAPPFNPKDYSKQVSNILQSILARLFILGIAIKSDQEAQLLELLAGDQERWPLIVTHKVIPKVFQPRVEVEDQYLTQDDYRFFLRQMLEHCNISSEFSLQSWFFHDARLERRSVEILQDAWAKFQAQPQMQTWESLYEVLESVSILYRLQAPFADGSKKMSSVAQWSLVLWQVNDALFARKVLEKQSQDFYGALQHWLREYPMMQCSISFWQRLVNFIQQQFHQYLQKSDRALQQFIEQPSPAQLLVLLQDLQRLSENYQKNLKSFWKGWWYAFFWEARCQVYLNLYHHLSDWVKDYAVNAKLYWEWQQQQQLKGEMQLAYRACILADQEQLRAPSRVEKFCFWRKKSNPEVLKKDYRTMLEDAHLGKKEQLRLELSELSRIFPNEIDELYALFYQTHGSRLEQQSKVWMLLAILAAYHSPFSTQFDLNVLERRFEVLLAEFDRWGHSRELLLEWDQMNPALV